MKLSLLSLLLFPVLLFAQQSAVDFGRSEDKGLNPAFKINADEVRNGVFSEVPDHLKGDISDRSLMRYSHSAANMLSQLLSEGNVYNDWPELTQYINDILEKIKAASGFADKDNIRAYVIKQGQANAFMTPTGAMFITLGMISQAETESHLAGIISHELAHYSLHHNVDGFVKRVQGDFKPGLFFNAARAMSRFSVENELDADKQASEYLVKAGYDYDGLIEAFQHSKKTENKRLLRDSYTYKIKETTHPSSEKRLNQLNEGKEKAVSEYGQGKKALIGESKLQQFQKEVKIEILKLLLSNYNYQECIERAFLYHAYEPDNATYIYYLMEAIRRMCYLNVDTWNEQFIVDKYYEFSNGFGDGEKRQIKDNFFSKFRYRLLGLEEQDFNDIEAKFYWESGPKFITYEQAFQFFFEIGKLLNEPECYFSNALSLSFDKEKMDFWLKKYLEFNTGKYRDYAQAMIDDNIRQSLPDKTLFVFDNFTAAIKQGPDYVSTVNSEENATLKSKMGEIFEDKDYLYLKDLRAENLSDYKQLKALENFSLQTILTKGNKLEIYELDPDFWLLFKKYKANKIEFANCLYRDKMKGKYTTEDFMKAANTGIEELLEKQEGNGRMLTVFITSIAIKEDEQMKKLYIEADKDLKKSANGYDTLVAEIKKGDVALQKIKKPK